MDSESDHWAIRRPPTCLYCGFSTRRRRAIPGNPNGNADRPYYCCTKCDEFSCFADMRGIHLQNPTCDCPRPTLSRLQIAGQDKEIPRALHYRCAVGGCSYFSYITGHQGQVLRYDGLLSKADLIMRGF